MSRFGVEVLTNGPGGETYKSLLVIYRCDTCGQLFDANFEEQHEGVHSMRAAFSEALDESNGIITVSGADVDAILDIKGESVSEEQIDTWVTEAEEGYSVETLKAAENKNSDELAQVGEEEEDG